MENVCCFDFDGTLTRRDSLLAFIRYAKGTGALFRGLLRYSSILVLMKIRLYPNWKAKQKFFAHFFKGMTESDFDALCHRFAATNRGLLCPTALKEYNEALSRGERVFVVSASIDNWVKPFVPEATVVGTKVETVDGRLTGRFLTHNCYGPEKVKRLCKVLPGDRNQYYIKAYGDSRGDRELLQYANESYLNFKRIK